MAPYICATRQTNRQTNKQTLLPAPGRAIVDEVLPPKFLVDVVPHLPAGSLGITVVQATGGWAWLCVFLWSNILWNGVLL